MAEKPKCFMSSYLSPRRQYKGLPTKTRGVSTTTRVNSYGRSAIKLAELTKPVGSRAHQSTSGRVWAFTPKPTMRCCTKSNCMHHFKSDTDPRIIKARAPLFDTSLSTQQLRVKLIHNWKNLKIVGLDGIERRVCAKAACEVFCVSKSFLYPLTKKSGGHTRTQANMLRAKKSVSITTWLQEEKTLMDAMPDDGTFICHFPRKKDLYDQYMLDALDDTSGILVGCKPDHFLKTLRVGFEEIRLRKHCRFAKCDFCEEWKGRMHDQSVDAAVRAEAKERYTEHANWAHVRERGFYHTKKLKAEKDPTNFMSIALDGTDQMYQGLPHFGQKIKGDGIEMRLKVHTQIAMVHGRQPMVFVATEDIYGDPNLTIECLNRIFKREEEQRPNGLPDTLFLQLDNCFRENKNTYVFAYLVWIIERTVFKDIFVSFLPVGHTHFDADQFASRVSVALKDTDVTTLTQYVNILRYCYTDKDDKSGEPIDVCHKGRIGPQIDFQPIA